SGRPWPRSDDRAAGSRAPAEILTRSSLAAMRATRQSAALPRSSAMPGSGRGRSENGRQAFWVRAWRPRLARGRLPCARREPRGRPRGAVETHVSAVEVIGPARARPGPRGDLARRRRESYGGCSIRRRLQLALARKNTWATVWSQA